MATANLQEELGRFDAEAPIESARTPPSSWYTSPEIFALERSRVFQPSWQPVARADQVAAPGSYVAGELVGEPWVVVRGEDGTLRAFANVCRHHAARVAEGEGRCEELVCPYHGWRYKLDGRLTSAPRLGRVEEFQRDEYGLRPLTVEVRGLFVWLCLGEPARSLDEDLAPLDTPFRGIESLRFVARRTFALDCNWKVFVDNYLDGGYHVAHLHKGLTAQLDMESYETVMHERLSIQSCGGIEGENVGKDFSGRIGSRAHYAWIYPNFMLNRYGPILDTNWVVPIGHAQTEVVFDYYFEEARAGDADFVQKSLAASEAVQVEDEDICASVQVGLASSSYDVGRYAPSLEMGELHFHRLLAADLRD